MVTKHACFHVSPLMIVFLLLACTSLFSQSPHEASLKLDCGDCHSSKSWTQVSGAMKFNHTSTGFDLIGEHKTVPCKGCHQTLNFSQAGQNCSDCHVDVHNATTSLVCEKCHTPVSWLVHDVRKLHQNSRFPLVGMHAVIPCEDCHKNFSSYKFDIIGIQCFDCHANKYYATTNPNHIASGFDTRCETCHNLANDWSFYHDAVFPIYTGSHNGTWNACTDCHASAPNYADFSCLNCHEHSQTKMDEKHNGEVGGYRYESHACYSCHPQGSGGG